MFRNFCIVLILAASLAPAIVAETPPAAPAAVVALSTGLAAEVSWLPSSSPVDYYNVYGMTPSGGLEFVTESIAPSAVVVGDYIGFAVSAVYSGAESDLTYTSPSPCIRYSVDPPAAWIEECRVTGHGTVKLP